MKVTKLSWKYGSIMVRTRNLRIDRCQFEPWSGVHSYIETSFRLDVDNEDQFMEKYHKWHGCHVLWYVKLDCKTGL